jgi:DNA-binding MarR family transcriptional regulator
MAESISEIQEFDDQLDFKLVELFFFAYRDFISDADELLADMHFGRAHHRVLHFVNRHPGMSVAKLLEILQITKQSLGPVLRQLIETGHLVQHEGAQDRRKRLLHPTQKGRNLSIELMHMQSRRIMNALDGLSATDRETVEKFLIGMIEPEERAFVEDLVTAKL